MVEHRDGARHQHVTEAIRGDVAGRVGGLLSAANVTRNETTGTENAQADDAGTGE